MCVSEYINLFIPFFDREKEGEEKEGRCVWVSAEKKEEEKKQTKEMRGKNTKENGMCPPRRFSSQQITASIVFHLPLSRCTV